MGILKLLELIPTTKNVKMKMNSEFLQMVLEAILKILLILIGIFLCWKIYQYQPFTQSTIPVVLHEIVVHEDEEEICDQKYKSKGSKTKRHKSKRSKTCKK